MPRSQSLYPTERTRRVGALGHTLETIRDAQAEKSNSEDFEKFSENAEHSDNLAHKDSTSFVSLFYHSNPVSKAGISSGIAQSRMRASTTTVGKDSVRIFSCFFACLVVSKLRKVYHVCRTMSYLTRPYTSVSDLRKVQKLGLTTESMFVFDMEISHTT